MVKIIIIKINGKTQYISPEKYSELQSNINLNIKKIGEKFL